MEPTGPSGVTPPAKRSVNILRDSSELQSAKDFALLLIGPPGARKSSTAIQFPNPMVFDCDRKIGNLRVWYPKVKYKYVQPDVDDDGHEVPKAEKWPRLIELFKAYGNHPDTRFNIFDSLTQISDYLIDFLMANEPDSKKPKRGGIATMSEALWYPYKERLTGLISAVRSSGKPSIWTVHERAVYSEGEVVGYKPTISGQLAETLCGRFTDAWRCFPHLTVEDDAHPTGVAYMVRTVPDSKFLTLFSSYGVPQEFEFSWPVFARAYPHIAALCSTTSSPS